MNSVTVCGNVGKEPQSYGNDLEHMVCRFSIADTFYVKGEKRTKWWTCVAFGKTANNIVNMVEKGAMVAVAGTIVEDKYVGKDGTEMTSEQIQVSRFEFCNRGAKAPEEEKPESFTRKVVKEADKEFDRIEPEELPFY